MAYTVKQLARLAGVSVRTLHHYDSIGLLKPASVSKSGYRLYEYNELLKLQQILFFKELKFSLKQIKELMDAPEFNHLEALKHQQDLLGLQKKRLSKILKTISQTIQSIEEERDMSVDKMYEGLELDKETIESYKTEAKQRWGNTNAYKQSMQRIKHWSKETMDEIKQEGQEIVVAISKHMDLGYNSPEVQAEIKKYHEHMNRFYDCSPQMFAGLGDMYVQDHRFMAFYENIAEGLAQFMRAAMHYYRDTLAER